ALRLAVRGGGARPVGSDAGGGCGHLARGAAGADPCRVPGARRHGGRPVPAPVAEGGTAMHSHPRSVRILVAAALAAVVVLRPPTARADAKPRSRAVVNQAVAVDAKTGRQTSRVAWMVRTNTGGALPSNFAKAQTWCNDCHTTAIALQIVLMGNVTTPTASWN